jgi:hypothetical protein
MPIIRDTTLEQELASQVSLPPPTKGDAVYEIDAVPAGRQ